LFSASPGRIVVGVLPQNAKYFESQFKVEDVLPVANVKGDKIWGLPLNEIQEKLIEYEKDHIT
jgi:hypothetical protein